MTAHYNNLQQEDINGEKWEYIPGYEGLYMCSNLGRMKSMPCVGRWNRCVLLKQTVNDNGYLIVNVYNGGASRHMRVHRAIGESFLPNPFKKRTINHKDKVKTNNVLENLEWATHSEQHIHAYKNGRKSAQIGKFVELNIASKPVLQLSKSGEFIRRYSAALEAERELGVCSRHIASVCKGNRITTGGYKWEYA